MKQSVVLLIFCVVAALSVEHTVAQSKLFIPKEIQKAYENGTRSYDGKPGPEYWQNNADYKINVEIIPSERKIVGSERVTYYNNSPDDLNSLVVRLYYDVFKEGNPRASSVNLEDVNEGADVTRLIINGKSYDLANNREVRRSGTNMIITLKEPLAAGRALSMECDWSQLIPKSNRRTGVYDSTSFFVAYFYPQIAVYDDVFGWDDLNYSLRTEFYNGLSNFDVNITAPKQFTIWSTGVLQNAKEVYPASVFEKYTQAKTAKETINVITPADIKNGYSNQDSVWNYKADAVSDFAFCLSDHFAWDATSQQVDGRNVLIGTAFPADKAAEYVDVTAIQQKTMKHFSEDIPGVPYPYPEFTTFIGLFGGGMEFPMMANNAGPGRGVTVHEMYHTYFPMYVRVNERRFAWMDEGWADYITSLVTERYFENNTEPLFSEFKGQIQGTTGSISDIPLITSSQFTDGTNYGYTAYPLPAFIYSILHHHLGDEVFFRAYKSYIERWAKKSPTPWDFFYTMENVSGQDLSWLWKPWFFEYGYPEVKIKSFEKGKLVVENTGSKPVPLTITAKYKDGKDEVIVEKASIWNTKSEYATKIANYKEIKMLTVNLNVADLNELDNFSPELKYVYDEFNIPEDFKATYTVAQFPVETIVSEKEGLLHLRITNSPIASYLIPVTDRTFTSLDGTMKVEYKEDGSLTMEVFGFNLTATKSE